MSERTVCDGIINSYRPICQSAWRFNMSLPRVTTPSVLVAVLAAAAPSLLAYNVSPSPTFLNQSLAFALWAAFVIVAAPQRPQRDPWPLYTALAILALVATWSCMHGALPASLALSAIGAIAAAAVLAAGGAGARNGDNAADLFAAFCWAWLVAGLLNVALSLVQVFAPDWPDGTWIANSGYPGRSVGNLRQPNHLSSLLLWSCIAVVGLLELQRLRRNVVGVVLALLVFAVVLTASRTGLVSVVLLALWGLADRRLSKPARVLLVAAPVVYALSWLGMAEWAKWSAHSFGGSARLAETDISSSRFAIWRDTLGLIRMFPWAGVGFGEFNLAWTLTPFPHRPVAFFDHTHNLPLQLAVELGLPLATLVMGLLLWGVWRGARNAWSRPTVTVGTANANANANAEINAEAGISVAQRCAMLMVVMIGLHSMLEYPLWYSYFLLPAAWAFGFALQGAGRVDAAGKLDKLDKLDKRDQRSAPPPSRALAASAAAVALCAALSVVDYWRVAVIFSPDDNGTSLTKRIANGQHSVLFAHHADYAAVTAGGPVPDPAHAFNRVAHYLLDTRLMMAWAKSLAAQGQLDQARHLAARLREFGKADAEDFFSACPAPEAVPVTAGSALPFQCQQPTRVLRWTDFLPR